MNYLTSIRGIAAFIVVLYHVKVYLLQHDLTQSFSWLYSKGYLAVDFFFILSGFIISFKYQPLFNKKVSGVDFYSFIVKRIARIFPLHAFVMLCYLLIPLAFFITGKELNSEQYTLTSYFFKFFLVDMWLVGSSYWNSWNVPSWTISTEFFAYLTFPLVALLFSYWKRAYLFAYPLAAALLVVLYSATDSFSLGQNIQGLGLFRCSLEFLCGACIYNIYQNHQMTPKAGALLFITTLVLLITLFLSLKDNIFYIPILFSLLLLSLLHFNSFIHRILETKPLVYLGDISYSVYLTHTLVLNLYTLLVLPNTDTVGLGHILAYVALTLVLSSASYQFVELPARRIFCARLLTLLNPPKPAGHRS